jgi:hypothetical protein
MLWVLTNVEIQPVAASDMEAVVQPLLVSSSSPLLTSIHSLLSFFPNVVWLLSWYSLFSCGGKLTSVLFLPL